MNWKPALRPLGPTARCLAVLLAMSGVAFAQNTPPLIFGKGDPTHLSVTSNQDVFTGIYFPGPGQTCFAVAGASIGCNPSGGGGAGNPGGIAGQLQYNNSGAFGGFTVGGDCSISVPNISCTKTGGVPFSVLATADPASPPALGGTTAAAGRFSSLTDTGVTGIATNCLYADTNGLVHGTAAPCGGSGSAAFNNITTGTNTTAAMTVGTGGSIVRTGTGAIDASLLLGGSWSSPGAIGGTSPAAGTFTSLTTQNIVGSVQCVRASSLGVLSGTGADCNTLSFAGINGGTNTSANMIVGSGATLTATGAGTIGATTLLGSTWGAPPPIGSTTANSGRFSSLTDTGITGIVKNCLYADANGLLHGEGVDCGAGGGGGSIASGTAAQVAIYPATGSSLSGATANGGCAGLKVDTSGGTIGTVFPVEATITANYTVGAGDMGCTIPVSGAPTISIPAAGIGTTILAPGQAFSIQNINSVTTSTGIVVTNSSGAAMSPDLPSSFFLAPGESATFQGVSPTLFLVSISEGGNMRFEPTIHTNGLQATKVTLENAFYSEPATSCYLVNTTDHISSAFVGSCGSTAAGSCGAVIEFTAATAVSVDPGSGMDPGCEVTLIQGGTGKVSIVNAGVTIHNAGTGVGTRTQWSVMKLDSLGGSTVVLSGDTS